MIHTNRPGSIAIGLLLCFSLAKAQNTPTLASLGLDFAEFNKRAILPIEVGAGFSSQQSKALFYVQVSPQFSLLAHHWRVGATIGGAYTTVPSAELPEKWVGYAGPKLSYKLLDLAGTIGGLPDHIVIGNINVFVEHLWAGSTVKLVGGGLAVDVAKRGGITINLHRDYEHQSTWVRMGINYNVVSQKAERTFPNQ